MATTKRAATAESHEDEPVEDASVDVAARREDELEEDALIGGALPHLLPALSFRQRERSNLMKMFVRTSDLLSRGTDDESDGDGKSTVKLSSLSDDEYVALLDVLADVDDFFESIAVDKPAYREWATGGLDKTSGIIALLNRYMADLGE